MAEFFEMGGYAAYVWPAYGVAMLVMAALGIHILRSRRRMARELAAHRRDAPHRRRARGETI